MIQGPLQQDGDARARPEAACGAQPKASTERVRTRAKPSPLKPRPQRLRFTDKGDERRHTRAVHARANPKPPRGQRLPSQAGRAVQGARQAQRAGVSDQSPKGSRPEGARCEARERDPDARGDGREKSRIATLRQMTPPWAPGFNNGSTSCCSVNHTCQRLPAIGCRAAKRRSGGRQRTGCCRSASVVGGRPRPKAVLRGSIRSMTAALK